MGSSPEAEDRLQQGRRLLKAGEFAAAEEFFRTMTGEDPDDATAFEGLGMACFSQGNHEGAFEAFTRVTQLVPQQARPFVNLGAVLNRLGRHQQALQALRKALSKDRSSSEAYYNMGLAHRGLGQLRMAVSAYREAIRRRPDMAEAHQNLANTYVALENYPQAVTHYRKALELRPDFERAERGLQQAEQAIEQRTAGGILDRVAPPQPQTAHERATGSLPPISEDSLEIIDNSAIRARDVAHDLVRQLKQDFQRSLVQINKVVTSQPDSSLLLEERLEVLRQVIGEMRPRFQELETRVHQLRSAVSGGEEE